MAGCDSDREGCAGSQSGAACISVTSIVPRDTPSGATSNVDVQRNICGIDDDGALILEPFTDHVADITFRNIPDPGALSGVAVTLERFTLDYQINRCPAQASECPQLFGLDEPSGQTFTLLPNTTQTITLPFVPLRVKEEYRNANGEVGAFVPAYTALYTFTFRTQFTDDSIVIAGRAEFTITDFDACPED